MTSSTATSMAMRSRRWRSRRWRLRQLTWYIQRDAGAAVSTSAVGRRALRHSPQQTRPWQSRQRRGHGRKRAPQRSRRRLSKRNGTCLPRVRKRRSCGPPRRRPPPRPPPPRPPPPPPRPMRRHRHRRHRRRRRRRRRRNPTTKLLAIPTVACPRDGTMANGTWVIRWWRGLRHKSAVSNATRRRHDVLGMTLSTRPAPRRRHVRHDATRSKRRW